ncbi:MAG: nuclear transport factor 2 family protein [Candidatus Aminicenantes bacterium]|jgi:ketosteroid isomerase-like protein
MKGKFLVVLLGLVFLTVFSCTQKSETPEEAKARIQQESAEVREVIESHNANLNRWYASGDIDSVVTVFAEDARVMPSNAPAIEGREAIRGFWTQAMTLGQWNFNLETVSVIANGSIAVELGRYTYQIEAKQEFPPGIKANDSGDYVCYWRLEDDGKWRIVYDIPSSDLPCE